MKTNRSLAGYIFLSIITFGIYALFFWSNYAKDMNLVCEGDGRHTRGIFARLIFCVLTLGLYDLVWIYKTGERISLNAHKRGLHNNVTGTSVLLWTVLGSFVIIGPLVAVAQMIGGLNDLCADYNAKTQHGSATINININQ